MKCFLHVGPTKTGSTTIQAFMRKNKDNLLARGVLAIADKQFEKRLPFLFKDDPNLTPWAKRKQLDQPEKMEALNLETHNHLHEQVEKYQPDTLLLSSEGLFRISGTSMTAMRKYLRKIASETEIIFYLRRQDFRVLSSYKNMVRNNGYTGDIITDYRELHDGAKAIFRFADCFGSSAIKPVICRDSHPDRDNAPGHIEALLETIFPESNVTLDNFTIPEPRNIAWDYKALLFMREFNKAAENNPELETHRLQVARLLQDIFSGGEKIRINRAMAEAIVANYQPGSEAIRQQYFPDQDTLFSTDFSMYSENTTPQPFGTEESVQVSLSLIQYLLENGRNTTQ